MTNRDLGIVVNLNSNYTNFSFNPYTITSFLAFFPFVYIIPTFLIVFRIIRKFVRNVFSKKDPSFNRHIFIVLVLSQFSNIGFFLADLFVIRAPSTGIMTSWCYSQAPNQYLTILFIAQAYFNYCSMLYPVLFSVIRLVITCVPNKHDEINTKILKCCVPCIHIWPLLFNLYLIPALGVCRQHFYPYPLGAVYVHFINSWRGMKGAPFTIVNSAVWLTTCLILNWILYRKLRKFKSLSQSTSQTNPNSRNRTTEISLSVTTFAMLSAYTTHLIFLGAFMIDYDVATYLVVIRPFGFDLELCAVPWVFYLTHPAFRKRKDSRIVVNSIRTPLKTVTS